MCLFNTKLFEAIMNNGSGGAKQDRTADLLRARQALSQLSYSPIEYPLPDYSVNLFNPNRNTLNVPMHISITLEKIGKDLVGLGRLELPTSPLSGVRSNQLSYRPILAALFSLISRLALCAVRIYLRKPVPC